MIATVSNQCETMFASHYYFSSKFIYPLYVQVLCFFFIVFNINLMSPMSNIILDFGIYVGYSKSAYKLFHTQLPLDV